MYKNNVLTKYFTVVIVLIVSASTLNFDTEPIPRLNPRCVLLWDTFGEGTKVLSNNKYLKNIFTILIVKDLNLSNHSENCNDHRRI